MKNKNVQGKKEFNNAFAQTQFTTQNEGEADVVDTEDEIIEEETELHKVGEAEVLAAIDILNEYKAQKANLDSRIVENQERWKKRYHNTLDNGDGDKNRVKIHTSWLHSCIDNKVADYMDNYPEPNVLAKEPSDEQTAKILTSILPTILDETDFEHTYYNETLYKVQNGTGVFGCFWNQKALNGLGEVDIRMCDILNLFWEGGIDDIQKSPHFFSVDLVNNKQLELEYPDLKGKLGNSSFTKTEYIHDESISTNGKSYVVDWYYKANVNGRDVVHYCKFVNNYILYATENDPKLTDRGLYDDGQYPFIFDVLFPIANSAAGYGYMDLLYEPQMFIDKMAQAMSENTLMQATPRWLIRDDSDVDQSSFADTSKHFVKAGTSLGSDSIQPIQVNPINAYSLNMYMQMIDEMKETSGNRDVSTGGVNSGVTASSAIAALQETGAKTSRMQIKGTYRAYRQLINMIIERIRQFYDLPRTFRIIGNQATQEYVEFTNAQMQLQESGFDFGTGETYLRLPCFDVEVSASKASPYSKMANNEMYIQLYQLGMFDPQNADPALALMDALDIPHKDRVVNRIKQNGTMLQYIQQMSQVLMTSNQIITELTGADLMNGQMINPNAFAGNAQGQPQSVNPQEQQQTNGLGEVIGHGESGINKKAKQRVADSTTPE